VSDFQLQIEHALDLEGPLALFIDAGTGTPAPFTLRRSARRQPAVSSHALAPAAVLQVFRDVRQRRHRRLRAVRARRRLRLGAPERGGRTQSDGARQWLANCLANPTPAHWRQLAGDLAAYGPDR
jgi:hypothetical protein